MQDSERRFLIEEEGIFIIHVIINYNTIIEYVLVHFDVDQTTMIFNVKEIIHDDKNDVRVDEFSKVEFENEIFFVKVVNKGTCILLTWKIVYIAVNNRN